MVMPDLTTGAPLPARIRSWLAGRADAAAPDLLDWVIAAVCFAAFTVPVLLTAGSARAAGLAAAFGAGATAPLTLRRRWPVSVLLVIAAVCVAAALAGVVFTPFVSNAGAGLAVAAFTAAERRPRAPSATAAAVAGAATWISLPIALRLHPGQDQDAVQLLAIVPGWLMGDMARTLRGYRQQLDLARRRQAAEELALARASERLALSREVHDVVSHSLSAIAVQAGVARLVADTQPGQARAALSAIETASRAALDELRGLLRQLRDPGETAEAAAPGLGDLPALVGRLRQAGLDVGYRSCGPPARYGPALELSAYRIAQEALTNVTKHARGARALIEVDHGPDQLTLTVTDDGGTDSDQDQDQDRAAAAGGGLGIPGMAERAALLGGTLAAGPAAGGGFVVTARPPSDPARTVT